jgi:hypothetical protein
VIVYCVRITDSGKTMNRNPSPLVLPPKYPVLFTVVVKTSWTLM